MKALIVLLVIMCGFASFKVAAETVPLERVEVCPAGSETPPVQFTQAGCYSASLAHLDIQGRDLWVRAKVKAPDIQTAPYGLFVSAKASGAAYLNGVLIGRNGMPGRSQSEEIPGQMDIVFSVPDSLWRTGENEVVMRLSSFHGYLRLKQPIHWVAIAPYQNPQTVMLGAYWPALVTFGVLVAGALFFAVSALAADNRHDPLWLSVMSAAAAGQLFFEVYRGLVAYAYPFQDLRLMGIVACSVVFGLSMGAMIIGRYYRRRAWPLYAGMTVLIALAVVLVPGYDGKASLSVMVSALCCAAIVGWVALKKDVTAAFTCVALTAFAGSILFFDSTFLDKVFYYEVSGLLMVMFAIHAIRHTKERQANEKLRIVAHDLELALTRATDANTPVSITVNSAGSVQRINAADIAYCKGADDYVELHQMDKRVILHTGGLTELEAELPAGFLRVHRSYIVNTACVEKLTREPNGTGFLRLSNGDEVSVSRRIMPKVRKALISAVY